MSSTSYVPVRFVGGPRGGTDASYRGEPPRLLELPADITGHYGFAFDRDDDGVKQRSGVYTWETTATDLDQPRDGDQASELLGKGVDTRASDPKDTSSSMTVAQPPQTPESAAQDRPEPAKPAAARTAAGKPASK